ncbi:hypothetical protein JHN63_35060 [Streptomyces sp. MBT65]|uniref:hypothetical protein n=1 Tax=Streptomyces sp. MBT65 TaxID=1488395 RepID=UPI00190B2963|nr:hypothetical protein [Streptomyces sp. MBT65]MBK3578931.1 hypothetical protein [Streptomyces sp. MBT65]
MVQVFRGGKESGVLDDELLGCCQCPSIRSEEGFGQVWVLGPCGCHSGEVEDRWHDLSASETDERQGLTGDVPSPAARAEGAVAERHWQLLALPQQSGGTSPYALSLFAAEPPLGVVEQPDDALGVLRQVAGRLAASVTNLADTAVQERQ